MSKRAAIILAFVALVVGILAGGWGLGLFYSRLTGRLIIGQLTSEAVMNVAELKMLRAGGSTNAVELLEIRLDGDLIGLTPFLTDRREFDSDPTYAKAIQKVKDYRTKFPRKSDSPELDAGTVKAFDLLNGQTNH
jgi:hypothetical protein